MSVSYPDWDENNAPVRICDGPNDGTRERGCGEVLALTEVPHV